MSVQTVLGPVYLAVRRDDESTTTAIADVAVLVQDVEKMPDGYECVTTPRGMPALLSHGTAGFQWLLCYKRCPVGNDDTALLDVEVLHLDRGDKPSDVRCLFPKFLALWCGVRPIVWCVCRDFFGFAHPLVRQGLKQTLEVAQIACF